MRPSALIAVAVLAAYLLSACQDVTVSKTPEKEGDEPGECTDDADNDADGYFDCGDPDCSNADACVDADHDGWTLADEDCDDHDPTVYPGAMELCDDKDNDCDELVDEDLEFATWYPDADGDTYGDPLAGFMESCEEVPGHVLDDTDCDDADEDVNPGADEVVCNDIDDDCDEDTEDTPDGDGDGDSLCDDCDDTDAELNLADWDADGYSTCDDDCDDPDAPVSPGLPEEYCNGVDDDCDPATEDVVDGDGDGHTVCDDCDDADADLNLDDLDADGWSTCDGDCDDADAAVNPDAIEIQCNGVDDDCDGTTEDAPDADGDGDTVCVDCDDTDGALNLADLDGDGFTTCDGDCDDLEAITFPDAEEICDGMDNDCDVDVDEGLDFDPWYPDLDNDGYGDALGVPVYDCAMPPGYVEDHTDCDDTEAMVNPGEFEIRCDGLNNDCDPGTLDAPDDDGDGADYCDDCHDGNAELNLDDADGDGWDTCDGDCDDTNPGLNLDDVDGDGWDTCDGDCDDNDAARNLDDADLDGSSTCEDDCDDTNASAYAGAPELCDGVDNDCDGTVELYLAEDFDADITPLVTGGDYLLEGDASQILNPGSGSLEVTALTTDSAGSFFFGTPLDLETFEVHFGFYLGGFGGAEGITLVMADDGSPTHLGCPGPLLGFGYDALDPSCSATPAGIAGLAVEIDTHDDPAYGDPGDNHVAVISTDMTILDVHAPAYDINDEQWRSLDVYYDHGLLHVYVDSVPVLTDVDTGDVSFQGILGVSGGTESGYQTQLVDALRICSFD